MECDAKNNINNAQLRQQESYAKRHQKADTLFNPGDKVLLKNLKRNDRKGGWSLMPWIGPFIIESLSSNNTCVLKRGDKILKTKHHIKNIKKFYERMEDNCDDTYNEVEIISQDHDFVAIKQYFRPVSKVWMITKCKSFNLPFTSNKIKFLAKKSSKSLSKPKSIIDVAGDGNCWFRCIFMWITHTEEHHELIRAQLFKVNIFELINN